MAQDPEQSAKETPKARVLYYHARVPPYELSSKTLPICSTYLARSFDA